MATAPPLPEQDVEAMSAEDLLRWAHEEYGDKLCLTCSWQKQSSVLVHMVSELGLDVPIVELDTHLFFRETYDTRDRLVERYGLKLLPPPPVITVAEQHKQEGPNLWERDPDRCCHIRKVEPLLDALKPYDAWISGIRRDQSPSRATTPKLQWSERYGVWKVHPLADWDERKSGCTSTSTRSRSTRSTTRATGRSAACPVPARPRPTRRSGQDAGPARTSSSAASTWTHPSMRRRRMSRRIHPLVHGPQRRRQDHDRRDRRPRARAPRPPRRVPRRRRRPHAPLEGPGLLEGGPRHEHRAHRLGRLAADAPRCRGARLRDLALRGDAATRSRDGRGARTLRRGLHRDLGGGVRPPRCQGPLREGVQRRDQGVHGGAIRTRSRRARSSRIDTEEHEPEESAQIVIGKLEELGLVRAEVAA